MKRKIIIVGPAFPYRGGIAHFNNSLSLSFKEADFDVKVYSFSLQYPSILFPGKTQYEEGKSPEGIEISSIINSINPLNWVQVANKIRKESPDYVIIRYWIPFMAPCLGTIARLIKKNTQILAITDNVIPHEKRIGDNILTRYFVRSCDAFLTLSSSVLDDLNKFTKTKNKIFIPHPIYDSFGEIVDTKKARENLQLEKDGKYLLFFGFIREYKGLDIMLRVMSDDRIRSLGIKLIVAGEFYESQEKYISMIDNLGISESIILKNDFIPEDNVKNYFCASDMVTQTYRTATQSGITQIAYHFERPMLVTNVGGLAEIVPDDEVGYVCNIDVKEISDSIIDFYQNERLEEFSMNTKRYKERFSWGSLVNGIDRLMKRIKKNE